MGQMVKVVVVKDLPAGSAIAVEAGGRKIALFNIDGSYYAIGDTCTHRGGPLSDGAIDGAQVTCPLHGAKFDVTSGAVLSPPAPDGVPHYRVQVNGDDIMVEVE